MSTCRVCSTEVAEGFRFCPQCGEDLQRPIACPSCSYSNEPNSKFCQECGRSLVAGKAGSSGERRSEPLKPVSPVLVQEEEVPEPSKEWLTLQFGYSGSVAFEDVIAKASEHPTFKKYREGKRAVYRLTADGPGALATVVPVARLVGAWKTRKVFVGGKETAWDEVFTFAWCFENRQKAYRPDHYCFGLEAGGRSFDLWGCTQTAFMFFSAYEWGRWGKFVDRHGTWEFDKARFRHELGSRLYRVRFCPALDLSFVEEIFNAFPEKINPAFDKAWEHLTWHEPTPGCLEVKHSPRSQSSGGITLSFETGPTYLVGVQPRGTAALAEIAARVRTKKFPPVPAF